MTPAEYQKQQREKLLKSYGVVQEPIQVKEEVKVEAPIVEKAEEVAPLIDNNENDFLQKSLDVINKSMDLFEKSGEGSRGGKIIGHTKSGKPIYENSKHESHKNFTEQDHEDAREAHMSETVTNRNMNEKDEAAADHGREIGKKKGDYEQKGKDIKEVLKNIKDQIGLSLKLDDHFSGILESNGKKYFNVILDDRVSESQDYNKLEQFANKYKTIRVEPNGVKRVSIFI